MEDVDRKCRICPGLLHSYVKNTPEMILKIDRAHLGDGNPRVVNPETGAFLGLF